MQQSKVEVLATLLIIKDNAADDSKVKIEKTYTNVHTSGLADYPSICLPIEKVHDI